MVSVWDDSVAATASGVTHFSHPFLSTDITWNNLVSKWKCRTQQPVSFACGKIGEKSKTTSINGWERIELRQGCVCVKDSIEWMRCHAYRLLRVKELVTICVSIHECVWEFNARENERDFHISSNSNGGSTNTSTTSCWCCCYYC